MTTSAVAPPRSSEPGSDLVSVRTRLDAIAVVRVVAVAVTLALLASIPRLGHALGAGVVALTLGHLVVTSVIEWARRRLGRRGLRAVRAVLVLDALYLGLVVARTGAHHSDLLFLVYLHVVAVTLLVSHREGLRVAALHAGLLVLGDVAVDTGLLDGGATAEPADLVATAVHAGAFLVVAAAAAACSWVNEGALRASRADLRALVELGADLEQVVHPDEVVDACCRHACRRLGVARAAVLIRDGDRWWGAVGDEHARAAVDATGDVDLVTARAWHQAGPVLVRHLDASADPVLSGLLPGAVNLVAVPVTVDGQHVGALVAEWGSRRDGRIPTAVVDALGQAAAHTSRSLRSALLLRRVEELATRDTLTGLANRRLFGEALAREVGRALREGTPLSLIVMDLDHFKAVNDTRGHQLGDEVLRQVGAVLTRASRAMDLPARYGGEEFVMLLPDADPEAALAAAERLRAAVASEVVAAPVTLSAGVATIPHNATDGDRLVAAADSALYEAKRAGRNRSVASGRHRGVEARPGNPTVTPDVHHG